MIDSGKGSRFEGMQHDGVEAFLQPGFFTPDQAEELGEDFFKRIEAVVSEKNKQRIEATTEINPKESFLQDFDESQIVKNFESAVARNSKDHLEVFSKNLDEKNQYKIYYEGDRISFQLLNESGKTAELIFDRMDKGWNMYHRLVQSQNLGISGTTFLRKAEDFFGILKQNKKIEEENIGFEAGQMDVIEWGLKNGYDFQTNIDREKFEKVKKGNPGFVTGVDLVDPEDGMEKKNFIVSRQKYDTWDKNPNIDYKDLQEGFVLIKKIQMGKGVQMPGSNDLPQLAA
ncbi:hypothetical protein HN954_01425 [bacterium]|jgi:hypothetical protein|nr:hypothetical protein [bacterium]MBT6831461.1 hypothetical protein [bacterium]MBT6996072.1 hypothetical protein [bacterium]MBT7772521.1 hypothetical protein [bacterium]